MIYTIGYQNLTLEQLRHLMDEKDINLLVDVRSKPYSRKAEFNQNNLKKHLDEKYLWLGHTCGGLTGKPVPEKCLKEIISQAGKNILIMCMENYPCDCHRFLDIATRLHKKGIETLHIFDGRIGTVTKCITCREDAFKLIQKACKSDKFSL